MNKGFSKYFKEGIRDTNNTFSNKSNYLRFYLVYFSMYFSIILFSVGLIVSIINSIVGENTVYIGLIVLFSIFLSLILIVFKPLFSIFYIKMGKTSKNHGVISISDTYTLANKNTFITCLISYVIMLAIFLAGLLMILAVGGLMVYILNIFVVNVEYEYQMIALVIVEAPVAILLLAYLIMFPLFFQPISYIIDTNPELTAGEVINRTIRTMRRTGKRTVFLFNLIYGLFNVINSVALGIFIYLMDYSSSDAAYYIFGIISILIIIEYLILYPRVNMLRNTGLIHLFDDVAYTSNKPNSIKGIDITKVKKVAITQDAKPIDLFDTQLNQRKSKKVKKQTKKSDIIENEDNLDSKSSNIESNEELINSKENISQNENVDSVKEELEKIKDKQVASDNQVNDESVEEVYLDNDIKEEFEKINDEQVASDNQVNNESKEEVYLDKDIEEELEKINDDQVADEEQVKAEEVIEESKITDELNDSEEQTKVDEER